eukprot:gnl/Chilomastix_caulleri/3109.p1 GENE.gnl/Chilomastix_caulleri/3109~~gnl/Chilomastix_caulleri/3109.p1  ORF type:complete len:103 (+),score=21.48 gnl/Chilomastix_caulleri/3109:195-503(+)
MTTTIIERHYYIPIQIQQQQQQQQYFPPPTETLQLQLQTQSQQNSQGSIYAALFPPQQTTDQLPTGSYSESLARCSSQFIVRDEEDQKEMPCSVMPPTVVAR